MCSRAYASVPSSCLLAALSVTRYSNVAVPSLLVHAVASDPVLACFIDKAVCVVSTWPSCTCIFASYTWSAFSIAFPLHILSDLLPHPDCSRLRGVVHGRLCAA